MSGNKITKEAWMKSYIKKLLIAALIALSIILAVFLVIFPNYFENGFRTFVDIGEYQGIKYVYGYGNLSGVFKKSENDEDYVKISDFIPRGRTYFHFIDEDAYFTTKGFAIVRLNLQTYEEDVFRDETMAPSIIGVYEKYLIVEDDLSSPTVIILDREDYSIVDSFDLIPRDYELSENLFQFTDYETKEKYEYDFDKMSLTKLKN